jgi:hypothetical protein
MAEAVQRLAAERARMPEPGAMLSAELARMADAVAMPGSGARTHG